MYVLFKGAKTVHVRLFSCFPDESRIPPVALIMLVVVIDARRTTLTINDVNDVQLVGNVVGQDAYRWSIRSVVAILVKRGETALLITFSPRNAAESEGK